MESLKEEFQIFFLDIEMPAMDGMEPVSYTHLDVYKRQAFPQDYAAMMTMIEKLQQIPKVVGIDIGGFTTDYLLMLSLIHI